MPDEPISLSQCDFELLTQAVETDTQPNEALKRASEAFKPYTYVPPANSDYERWVEWQHFE